MCIYKNSGLLLGIERKSRKQNAPFRLFHHGRHFLNKSTAVCIRCVVTIVLVLHFVASFISLLTPLRGLDGMFVGESLPCLPSRIKYWLRAFKSNYFFVNMQQAYSAANGDSHA